MHPIDIVLRPLGWAFSSRRAGETNSLANAPAFATTGRLTLTSPNFLEGEEIPAKHCGKFIGQNVSPALDWSALPDEASSLLLIVEDLDSPGTSPRLHAAAAFPATVERLTEGALTPDATDVQFLAGKRGPLTYAGPRPLPGHGPHHYRFHLYALDAQVDLATIPAAEHLAPQLSGHVLASGTLTGTRTA
ncbi:YbhB/YbcL family Raf kinase inhibitor-like protein [Demequina soli]|uniref:YbhB/YbcL family Raf kinase inhibitor-like protein n=1 Tax=Demequina soli TaxID=1638987 RepID=UPI0007820F88|nr:YbhB/YbcL family Raf kinase inhibitor-like protein [Demequina soli]